MTQKEKKRDQCIKRYRLIYLNALKLLIHCLYVLVRSLLKETNAENLSCVFKTITSFVSETYHLNPALVRFIIRAVAEKMTLNTWGNETLIHALSALTRFTEYYKLESATDEVIHRFRVYLYLRSGAASLIWSRSCA